MKFAKIDNFRTYHYNRDRRWEVGPPPKTAYLLEDDRLPPHAQGEVIICRRDGDSRWSAYHSSGIVIMTGVMSGGKTRTATAEAVIDYLKWYDAEQYAEAVRRRLVEIGVALATANIERAK